MLNPSENSHSTIPAFIAKLWHMVSDQTSDLISWGRDGTTFVIKDHNKFSSEMLPLYYKHNNMASFIRQLNMYSFHKVLLVESSTLKNQNELEFSHPNFVKDNPQLLSRIQRKIHSKEQTDVKYDPVVFNSLLKEVKQLRAIQELFSTKLTVMKKENAALWREHSILRQRHAKQEKIVNKVIHFLISMVQQSSINVTRRKVPLMIKDKPTTTKPTHRKKYVKVVNPKSPPIISEVDPQGFQLSPNEQIMCEEVLPEDLLLSYNELGNDVTETQTKNNTKSPEDIQFQQKLKSEVSNHSENEKQKRSVLKPVKRKSLIKKNDNIKKKKMEENKFTESYILPITEDELVSTSPVSTFSESEPSPKYVFIDNNDALVQFLETNKLDDAQTIKDNDCTTSEDNICYNQPLISQSQARANNKTMPSDQSKVDKGANIGLTFQNNLEALQNSSPNYTMPTSPIDFVVSPSTSITSLAPSQSASAGQVRSSSDNNQEVPNNSSLLQLAIPANINDGIRNREEAELHLDKVQSDLEILKDLLKGEGISLDANMVLELFNDHPIDLNMGPAAQSNISAVFQDQMPSDDQALISYTPSLLDLENELPADPDEMVALDNEEAPDYELNTPQIRTESPSFPDPL